jgi:hypothetical protein
LKMKLKLKRVEENELSEEAIQRKTDRSQKYIIFYCPVCDIILAIQKEQKTVKSTVTLTNI